MINFKNLNFPYYVYPNYPCSGYFDFEKYNKNIQALKYLINDIKSDIEIQNKRILFHLTIGAPIEEYFNLFDSSGNNISSMAFQWQQLFPDHLIKYAKNGGNIIHIIISPTLTFDVKNWKNPSFLNFTKEFMWKITIFDYFVHIISSVYNVEFFVFYTMMPTIDERNKKIYNNLLDKSLKFPELQKYANNIIQTNDDIQFISSFYDDLGNLFRTICDNGGTTTCFSFAVFNDDTEKRTLNNYVMFKEIVKCFNWNNYKKVSLLAEWKFMYFCYTVSTYCYDNSEKKLNNNETISYVTPQDNKFIDSYLITVYYDKLDKNDFLSIDPS